MARRRDTDGTVASGRSGVTLPNITALIEGGGQIMIGTMKPLTTNTAVAHDGRKRGGPAFLDSFRGRDKWKPAMVKLPPRGAEIRAI